MVSEDVPDAHLALHLVILLDFPLDIDILDASDMRLHVFTLEIHRGGGDLPWRVKLPRASKQPV